jgi:hypothetical protein
LKPKDTKEELPEKTNAFINDTLTDNPSTFSQDKLNIQKNSLLKLREENLLSEEEYVEKLQKVVEKEKELIIFQQEKHFNQLVLKQIEPLIQKLDDLLQADLITQNVYEIKKVNCFLTRGNC